MEQSILTSIKKVLGIEEDYTAYDTDVVMHINTVFFSLNQLGVGPEDGFNIQDKQTVWSDFLGDDKRLASVKSYVYLRVRLLFDPPETSYARESFKKQYEELEWRLNVHQEGVNRYE